MRRDALATALFPGPDEVTAFRELQVAIDRALDRLTVREAKIVRRYYGLEGHGCTIAELGAELGVSRGRVQQILGKALRKLRHGACRQLLQPHADLSVIERAERALEEARREAHDEEQRLMKEAEHAAHAAFLQQQSAARRAKELWRQRVGDEVGRFHSQLWTVDDRRRVVVELLDSIREEHAIEARSSDAVSALLRAHFSGCFSTDWWLIYDAWKRDVRGYLRRLGGSHVTFTRGVLADGSCVLYARRDPYTWYLFDEPHVRGHAFRWFGYVKAA